MRVNNISLQHAIKEVAQIFSILGTNDNGKSILRCSRCEGLPEKERGKSFQVLPMATTKMKEHIAVYCPSINPATSTSNATLRHTLLINLPEKQVLSLSKYGQIQRMFP